MKIGVIVPFHNAGSWLGRCLDSISDDFEVFMVNDHSFDDSEAVIIDRCSQRLHKNWNLVNAVTSKRGVAHARNLGLTEAICHGCHYVTFLDADDEYAPDAYAQMLGAIAEAPEDLIIQMNHVFITPEGSQRQRFPNRRGHYYLDRLPKLWASSCNKLFRTDLVKNRYFLDDLRHGEDELFVLDCLAKARRIYNSERVALRYHKDNPNSLSSSTTPEDLIGEQRALVDFLEEHRDDAEICGAIRQRQTELWNNPVYMRNFGGRQ